MIDEIYTEKYGKFAELRINIHLEQEKLANCLNKLLTKKRKKKKKKKA